MSGDEPTSTSSSAATGRRAASGQADVALRHHQAAGGAGRDQYQRREPGSVGEYLGHAQRPVAAHPERGHARADAGGSVDRQAGAARQLDPVVVVDIPDRGQLGRVAGGFQAASGFHNLVIVSDLQRYGWPGGGHTVRSYSRISPPRDFPASYPHHRRVGDGGCTAPKCRDCSDLRVR
jgi:hypothetical protein